jgi:alpha-methylacyl-CoA racemase
MGARPAALEGVTVLDFSTVGPASRCSRILADYGARVVKVGAPPRKQGVQVQPAFWAYSALRGMQQVRIDLKAPEGKRAFLALAAGADVIIESYRPGVADRLGVGFEAVREHNPRIIYCATSGYGQTGPASQWAGHDLNYLALGGYLHTTGRRADGGPPIPGATIADSAAGGMHAALAVFAALLRRERTGEGEYLDVSVAEGVLSLMSLYIDQHLATGETPGPGHDVLTGRYACYDSYRAADGKWLAVAAIEPHFYANLCKALGCEQWVGHQQDDDVQDRIRADFADAFAQRDRDDWVAELAPADTCVAPVNDIAELVRDPQLRARGAFARATHPEHGSFEQVAPALAGMERPTTPAAARSADETETAELLRQAGVPEAEIETMRADGVIA